MFEGAETSWPVVLVTTTTRRGTAATWASPAPTAIAVKSPVLMLRFTIAEYKVEKKLGG
jgi:hypothetical protein